MAVFIVVYFRWSGSDQSCLILKQVIPHFCLHHVHFFLSTGKVPDYSRALHTEASLLVYFLFILLVPASVTGYTNVIVSSNGSDLDSCVNDIKGCKNLTFALEYLSKADPRFPLSALIVPGQYQLEAGILFKNIEQRITLTGDGGLANIVCNNETYENPQDTGLAFVGSTNIDIINITLSGCGLEHDSTTVLNETFVTFNVSLYFESCFNVKLTSVTVRDSIGVGIQFYATIGTVEIHGCTIASNPAYPDEGYIGGGLLIEFPYCMPGNISSCGDVHSDAISNSHYGIADTSFEDNRAHNLSIEQRFVLLFGKNYDAFGYGGGLSIVFKGNASNNVFDIINCQWIDNTAVFGGGLYVNLQDNAYNNIVALSGFNVFTGNRAIKSGGGALFAYLFSPFTSDLVPSNNKFIINQTSFTNNSADARGGGTFYLTPRQLPNGTADDLNQLIISDCIWKGNKGRLGSAIDMSIFHTDSEGTIHDVVFKNCSFISNIIVISQSTGRGSIIGAGAMYIDTVPVVFNKSVTFQDNHFGTALVVSVSKVSFMPNTIAEFINNAGMNGGAIALHSSAFIEISHNTSFLFEGNKARNRGGAIYAESFGTSLEKTSLECLIRYKNVTVVPSKWSTTFNFSNNTANRRNNSIYASTIKPCALLSGYTDDINERLMDVFCWNEEEDSVWEYNSNRSQSACMSQIQTDIASFNPEKSDRVINVRPGKQAKLKIQPLNDQNSNVSEYIYHVYSQNEKVKIHNDYYYISDDTVFVYPTSKNNNVEGMILVEAVQQNIVQFDLKVVFDDCYPGLTKKSTTEHPYLQCTCSPHTKAGVFSCNNETFTAELLQGYWIGNYKGELMYGHCISCKTPNHARQVPVHITLNQTLDEFHGNYCTSQSGGVLCNQCKDGYAPAISYDKFKCVKCTHTVDPAGVSIFLICDVLIPLCYLIAVYIFDVPLTSGLFHGPILLCQLVSSIVLLDGGGIIAFNSLYDSSGADKLQRAYTGLYDSFNLYFARSLQETHCFSKHVTKFVTVIAINYVAALVPLFLVILAALVHYCSRTCCKCCMCLCNTSCKPNCRSDRGCYKYIATFYDSRKNKANFLATAIMLSYTNVAVITSYLLTFVALIKTETGKVKYVLYLDGTVDFLGKYHLPYFVFACVFGLTYLLIVPIFLFFYRPNNPKKNGGFLNHLLGQFQNEFRTKREIDPDQDGKYKAIINSKKMKVEIKLETWHLCTNTCFYFCKFRCTRHFNVYFITRFEPGNYQWFSGVLFFIRLLMVVPFIFAWNAFILLFFQFIICITYAIAVVWFHPYKRMQENGVTPKKIDPNIIEASSMLLLSLLIALSLYQYAYTLADVPLSKWAFILQGILVWIPLVWIAIVYCRLFYLRNWDTLRQWFSKVCCCCRRCCVVRDRDNEERQPLANNFGIHGSVNTRATELSYSHGFKNSGACNNESDRDSHA